MSALTKSQLAGLKELRAEAYRLAHELEPEWEGLSEGPSPLTHLRLVVSQSGELEVEDLDKIVGWALHWRAVSSDEYGHLSALQAECRGLARWIRGQL